MPRTSHQIGNHQVRRKISVAETLVEYDTEASKAVASLMVMNTVKHCGNSFRKRQPVPNRKA